MVNSNSYNALTKLANVVVKTQNKNNDSSISIGMAQNQINADDVINKKLIILPNKECYISGYEDESFKNKTFKTKQFDYNKKKFILQDENKKEIETDFIELKNESDYDEIYRDYNERHYAQKIANEYTGGRKKKTKRKSHKKGGTTKKRRHRRSKKTRKH